MSDFNSQIEAINVEQEVAELASYFDALDTQRQKRARFMVDLPERWRPISLPLIAALRVEIQKNKETPFVGAHDMARDTFALICSGMMAYLHHLMDKTQGATVRVEPAYNHLNCWIDDASSYFERFEARRKQDHQQEEILEPYRPLDKAEQSFASPLPLERWSSAPELHKYTVNLYYVDSRGKTHLLAKAEWKQLGCLPTVDELAGYQQYVSSALTASQKGSPDQQREDSPPPLEMNAQKEATDATAGLPRQHPVFIQRLSWFNTPPAASKLPQVEPSATPDKATTLTR